jgi:hypothetical protein
MSNVQITDEDRLHYYELKVRKEGPQSRYVCADIKRPDGTFWSGVLNLDGLRPEGILTFGRIPLPRTIMTREQSEIFLSVALGKKRTAANYPRIRRKIMRDFSNDPIAKHIGQGIAKGLQRTSTTDGQRQEKLEKFLAENYEGKLSKQIAAANKDLNEIRRYHREQKGQTNDKPPQA